MRIAKAIVFTAIMSLLVSVSAHASSITFGGTLTPGTNLGTATSLTFSAPTFVTSVSGDLAAFVGVPDIATFTDFSFVPFSEVDPLWVVGGYTFKLTDLTVLSQSVSGLVLIGEGVINGHTLVNAPFDFSFSADAVRNITAFSATNVDSQTPEPGSLVLLGTGLVFLGARGKRFWVRG